MAKKFSKKYGNKGWAFDYPVSAIWNKFLLNISSVRMPVNAWCYIPTSLPQEQAAKTKWFQWQGSSKMSIYYYAHLGGVWLIYLYDWPHTHAAGKVNLLIERRWHILYNIPSARLATGLLVSNAWIQLEIVQYWWWFWRQWCRDIASGIDRHPDRTFN